MFAEIFICFSLFNKTQNTRKDLFNLIPQELYKVRAFLITSFGKMLQLNVFNEIEVSVKNLNFEKNAFKISLKVDNHENEYLQNL